MEGVVPDMENAKQSIVIRILQEITQNIIKHARANISNGWPILPNQNYSH